LVSPAPGPRPVSALVGLLPWCDASRQARPAPVYPPEHVGGSTGCLAFAPPLAPGTTPTGAQRLNSYCIVPGGMSPPRHLLGVRVRRRRRSRFPHLVHSAHLSRSGISTSRQSCHPIRQRQSLAMTHSPWFEDVPCERRRLDGCGYSTRHPSTDGATLNRAARTGAGPTGTPATPRSRRDFRHHYQTDT